MIITRVLLLLLAGCIVSVSSTVRFYVKPSDQSCACHNRTPCETLANYARNSSIYFESNYTEFIFFPGLHHLDKNVIFTDLHRLSLSSYRKGRNEAYNITKIECDKKGVGLEFQNIRYLKLLGMVFTGCSKHVQFIETHPFYKDLKIGLYLNRITDLEITNTTMQNSDGYGIFMKEIYGSSCIKNSIFRDNKGTGYKSIGGNAVLWYHQYEGPSNRNINITIEYSRFLKGESNTFFASGLIVLMQYAGMQVHIVNSTMSNNLASTNKHHLSHIFYGGNLAVITSHESSESTLSTSSISIINSTFTQGKALYGGGIFIQVKSNSNSYRFYIADCRFNENVGGGISIRLNPRKGYLKDVEIFLINIHFDSNWIVASCTNPDLGTAMMVEGFNIQSQIVSIYINKCRFVNQTIPKILACEKYILNEFNAVLYVHQYSGKLLIEDSLFEHNSATAIAAFHSIVAFKGNVTLFNNTGYKGGGIHLCEASYVIMTPNTTLTLSHNHATSVGGGIFVQDQCNQNIRPICFYQIDPCSEIDDTEVLSGIKVLFINNTADFAGSQIYGGRVAHCTIQYGNGSAQVYHEIFEYKEQDAEDGSRVSSDPDRVSFCENINGVLMYTNITNKKLENPVYSGEEITVSLVLTGQLNGTVPGRIEVDNFAKDNTVSKIKGNFSDLLPKKCSDVTIKFYTSYPGVHDHRGAEVLQIGVQNNPLAGRVFLHVHILPVPLGCVSTGNDSQPYECIPDLKKYKLKCYVNNKNGIIQRKPPNWLGYVSDTTANISGFVFYPYCPHGYCKEEVIDIPTDNETFSQDYQCTEGRTGVLCGDCKPNLSLSMGSSRCIDCNSFSLIKTAGASIGFAAIMIVVILFLLIFNITITEGTMSGFLFYVNVFYILWPVLQPHSSTKSYAHKLESLFYFFIAGVNLVFGCDCCFYYGLDTTGRTWLQFIIVIYLWIITGLIVWICRRFSKINEIIGHNAVLILATNILFSYTSTTLAIIHSLTYARLSYPGPNGSNITHTVALYDGNIPFLGKKHLPLLIIGCIFGAFSLSFMLTLLCIQPLQRYSHWRLLKWVNKLKPLIDAYSCPHIIKPHCRFWNGFLLLIRSILFVIYMGGNGHDDRKILFLLSSLCLIILTTAWIFGGIYTKRNLNYLNLSYIINIGILSVVLRDYQKDKGDEQSKNTVTVIASFTSLSIAILTFFGTLFYHIYMQNKRWKLLKRSLGTLKYLCTRLCEICKRHTVNNSYQVLEGYVNNNDEGSSAISSSEVIIPDEDSSIGNKQYREPQLMDYDSI